MAGAVLVQSAKAASAAAVASLAPSFGSPSVAGGSLVAVVTQFQQGALLGGAPTPPADPIPAGWSLITMQTESGGTGLLSSARLTTWLLQRLNAPATTVVTFPFTGPDNTAESVVMAEFDGVYAATAVDKTGSNGSHSVVATLAVTTAAPTQPGELVVAGFGTANSGAEAFTPSAGFTRVADTGTTTGAASAMDYQVQGAAAAPTDTETLTPPIESAGVMATLKATRALTAAASETLSTTDAISTTRVYARQPAEALAAIADSVGRVGSFLAKSAEALSIADSIGRGLRATAALSDTVLGVDALTAQARAGASLSEPLSISDTLRAPATHPRGAAEALPGTVDTLTRGVHANAALSDAVPGADVVVARTIAGARPSEVLSTADALAAHGFHPVAAAETLPIVQDVVAKGLHAVAAPSEQLVTTDAATGHLGASRGPAELLPGIQDVIQQGLHTVARPSEVLTTNEQLAGRLIAPRALAEAGSIADSLVVGGRHAAALSDIVLGAEAVTTASAKIARPIDIIPPPVDVATARASLARTMPETLSTVDQVTTAALFAIRTMSEALQPIIDVVRGLLRLTGPACMELEAASVYAMALTNEALYGMEPTLQPVYGISVEAMAC